ncbi:MAG TPA: hypothetical protein VMY39_08265 [Planctomycetota bacterium]|nr:hypothetical protein [Planctomycetota bacterium]
MKRTWCDLSCEHASFPTERALVGACNTLQAIYCRRHKRLVPKNGPCLDVRGKSRKR